MQAFGTSERAAVDAAHSAATVGLVSRADFLAARDRAEAQAEAEAEAKKAAGVAASEKARDAQRARRAGGPAPPGAGSRRRDLWCCGQRVRVCRALGLGTR